MTKNSETLDEKIARVLRDEIRIAPYDPAWPERYEQERAHLLDVLPSGLLVRIEHVGSTSVPDLPAKPIVDMLIDISDVERGKSIIPEILEPLGYDCFWRPTRGDDIPPWYTWCIGRGMDGTRTHHLHFVAPGEHDDMLRFRDILRAHPEVAREYAALKLRLADEYRHDREAYTEGKGAFILRVLGEYGTSNGFRIVF